MVLDAARFLKELPSVRDSPLRVLALRCASPLSPEDDCETSILSDEVATRVDVRAIV